MTDLHVKYSRAENGIEVTEIDSGSEAVVQLRRRNGMTKLEKLLLASTVVFVIASAVFASLYLSERQHRNLKKETPSSENGAEENCKGRGQNQDENKRNKTKGPCDTTECANEVTKLAALGKNNVNHNCSLQILIATFF